MNTLSPHSALAQAELFTDFSPIMGHSSAAGMANVQAFESAQQTALVQQQLQLALTSIFLNPHLAHDIIKLGYRIPAHARAAYRILMHTLLACRIRTGAQAGLSELRRALQDQWQQPQTQQRWERLIALLSPSECLAAVGSGRARTRRSPRLRVGAAAAAQGKADGSCADAQRPPVASEDRQRRRARPHTHLHA